MFRIGEFSKIAQIPASLLRYYDEIDLFKPIKSDRDTGYRYYSVRQLTQLNRILALKDLGLTLEQVKRLVKEEISPEEIRGMLTLKKAQIEQTIQTEAMRLKAVDSRLQQLERQGQFQDEDIVLKTIPARPFLSVHGHFSYSAIGTWAENHQYKLIAPGREVFIVPPKLGHESEMVVEIQFPVKAIAS